MAIEQRFHSLQDFLASTNSDVDGVLNDGGGFPFPVKGRELNATVLFADISGFSTRTLEMTPVKTLIYVQNFFAWISAEALRGRPGIVDKYIGDEVMVVFAEEFGSEDPFGDAIQAAIAMSRHDVHAYRPHIGVASGPVIVGYAGTPLRYDVSVFGAPVALAARCAAVKPAAGTTGRVSSTIVAPEHEWDGRTLSDFYEPEIPGDTRFRLLETRKVPMKGLGDVAVREIHNTGLWAPSVSAEVRAQKSLDALIAANRYWPRTL
ncbi:adenylate/guanylate cyclase domain-containing protein [Rhodococcus sp. NPDC019627]|uniref:adenylate/guanylate cyclase domain-containing protein n=1 Tax=unclassified Rhodococcus (in: high G+C Gram-positive bacteria) TaxID=192944 RepID=UPI0033EFA1F3